MQLLFSKKETKIKKKNFSSVSILPVLSRIFEKLMSKRLSTSLESILSKFQYGFRKGHSTQHCLLLMFEKWKHVVDNNEVFGALLAELSKVFGCLSHDLLIAKLHSYGLSLASLRSLSDYLSNRTQRIKVENVFSKWQNIETGVLQRINTWPTFIQYFCLSFVFNSLTILTLQHWTKNEVFH